MSGAENHMPRRLMRADAARLLRRARATPLHEAGECIGWACCALPESRAARRLKIDLYLHEENFEAADALLARTMMQQRDHPLMRLRYAQSLLAQGRLGQAYVEIRRVQKLRPRCLRACVLAAQIARRLGDDIASTQWFARARSLRPAAPAMQALLIRALLAADHVEAAAAELSRLPSPPAWLGAAVLMKQGRALDAIDVLRAALASESAPAMRDELLSRLIEALDAAGTIEGLRAVQRLMNDLGTQAGNGYPKAALSAARVMLARGDRHAAADFASQALADPAHKAEALRLQAVALQQADARVTPVPSTRRGADTAPLWLTAMLGRLVADIESGRDGGADPSVSLLQPMVRQALATFDGLLASSERESLADREAIERHRAACLAALGQQPDERSSHSLPPRAIADSAEAERASPLRFAA